MTIVLVIENEQFRRTKWAQVNLKFQYLLRLIFFLFDTKQLIFFNFFVMG